MKIPVNNFSSQLIKIEHALTKELPGPVAHSRMAPAHRDRLINDSKGPEFARKSSVLILLFPDESGEINTAFIKRVEYDGVHSGQIAFPGGKSEETDTDLIDTALREAEEEVGIKRDSIRIIGKLSNLFVPPSNYIICPVVAKTHIKPDFIPDNFEVAEIFTVPLKHFLNPDYYGDGEILYKNGQSVKVPGYYYEKYFIWGATAMILSELMDIFEVTNELAEK
ncbi:MAG: CoA pyrophosphatase [Lentimicrobium sp.]|nr:CoA pyrophosphatase [Lentimicrobium sp.]